MLRDKLVIGLKEESTHRIVLTEKNLTFTCAVEIAVAREAADKDVNEFRQKSNTHSREVNTIKITSSKANFFLKKKHKQGKKEKEKGKIPDKACNGCGKSHWKSDCPFKNAECYLCKCTVHIAKVLDNQAIVIVKNSDTNLLGRDLLPPLYVFPSLADSSVLAVTDETVESKFPDVFEEELGTFKGREVSFDLKESVSPKYCQARNVPYSMSTKVDPTLDKLLEQDIIQPLPHSNWAAPIVPILKGDGTIHICGDYWLIINQATQVTADPVLTVGSGNFLSKLDMTNAYNQIVLSPESHPQTTINTHCGLFQYNRLCFGIASAPSIFQHVVEDLLRDGERSSSTPFCAQEVPSLSVGKEELSVQQGCLLWGSRVIIPPQGREQMLRELHQEHLGSTEMKQLARSYFWWPGFDHEIEKLSASCKSFWLIELYLRKLLFIHGTGLIYHGYPVSLKMDRSTFTEVVKPLLGEEMLPVIDWMKNKSLILLELKCESCSTFMTWISDINREATAQKCLIDINQCFLESKRE
ncbi:uncharacterized protein [Palaemon carinicauda]|uniref:uncharacterized protein n=1 Tax=Palaemon carinicauda TaxID=392227 RepID=UPI0035B57308